MKTLRAIAMAFSLYSTVPIPSKTWDDRLRGRVIGWLPLVGVLVGVLVFLAACLPIPALIRGAFLCAIPLIVTGGIHLDGFADTHDALASHAEVQTKQRILHDPHIGAFGVMYTCLYLVVYFACAASLEVSLPSVLTLALSYVLSRAMAGFALMVFPLSPDSSMLKSLEVPSPAKGWVKLALGCVFVFGTAVQISAVGLTGLAIAVATFGVWFRYSHLVRHDFEGNSGDLAGWCIQSVELVQLLALVLGQCLLGPGGILWF